MNGVSNFIYLRSFSRKTITNYTQTCFSEMKPLKVFPRLLHKSLPWAHVVRKKTRLNLNYAMRDEDIKNFHGKLFCASKTRREERLIDLNHQPRQSP